MFTRIFGRKTCETLNAWHPGMAPEAFDAEALRRDFMSPASPALGAALRGCEAVVREIGLTQPATREQTGRIFDPLDDLAEPNAAFLAAVEAMLRLPYVFSFLIAPKPTPTAYARALERAVERYKGYAQGVQTFPDLPNTVDLVVATCRAIGNLLAFPDATGIRGRGAGFDTCKQCIHFLTWRVLRDAPFRNDARILAALDTLLERIDQRSYELNQRATLAQWIVTARGLPRTASATLVAVDADFARREAARAALRAEAGPALDKFVDGVLDLKIRSMAPADFAALPEVVAALDQPPQGLGRALMLLHRLHQRAPTGYPNWGWLVRHEGAFTAEPYGIVSGIEHFRALSGLILRKRIEVSDAEMASLVATVTEVDVYQSKHFLNQALKIARAAPDGLTKQALQQLVENAKVFLQDWKKEVAALAPADGVVASLAPPVIDVTEFSAPEILCRHFADVLDPRLHDAAHRYLVDRLAEVSESEVETARQAALAATKAEQVGKQLGDMLIALADADYRRFDSGEMARRLANAAAVVSAQLGATAPLVTRYAAQGETLRAACAALESKSAPTQKFLAQAGEAANALTLEERLGVLRGLIDAERSATLIIPPNKTLLRGLIYLASAWETDEIGTLLAEFALRYCYQSSPRGGIMEEKLGNACVWVLSQLPDGVGVPFLARILARVKYPKFRSRIDSALNEAAASAGMSRGELDELCVPGHGLDAAGQVTLEVGGGLATLRVGGRKAELEWQSEAGKPVKAPTTAMKADKEGLDAAKALAKEVEADLATQVVRLQRLYLEDRRWDAEIWQQRYLEHPLVGTLARRLIWWVDGPGGTVAALWADGMLRDVAGAPVALAGAHIRLWHPIEATPEAVQAWCGRIAALQVEQPFAQAWREVYRVTDAELTTATYSNRWAGHILKQHQFLNLARLQGWTVTHRMWVDARNDEPAHLVLPVHGLVADYWVEGAGDRDNPEVLESNAYVYVATDRLMFSRIAAGAKTKDSAHGPSRSEAVPVAEVPPVVFSEVMRHCDLFTAVASIASDPAWLDRGADAAHPDQWRQEAAAYWERESTAPLREAALVRRTLLEAIVPKLAIAPRCSFDDRSLIVRGNVHNYRIHIGSAAVTIMPLMRHLCIVPASGGDWGEGRIYLPFAGDRTLSVVLSKAVLLAADDKISDPVILRQL